jgi:cell wall-associated NlpC family hydrolase
MNVASYFDDLEKASALNVEARSWIGTPFREYYQQKFTPEDVKGVGGGIDCVGLVQEIFARIGATEQFVFPRESSDYQAHGLGEKILRWMRGQVEDPQSERLSEILIELAIPEDVTDPNAVTPRDFFKPGDICVLRHGSLFHLPLIIDNHLHIVNALPRLGVVEGTMQDSTFSSHLVAVFRLRGAVLTSEPESAAEKN